MSEILLIVNAFAMLRARGVTLTEYEQQLYEAASRYATTLVKLSDAFSQSAVIRAERGLDELREGNPGGGT